MELDGSLCGLVGSLDQVLELSSLHCALILACQRIERVWRNERDMYQTLSRSERDLTLFPDHISLSAHWLTLSIHPRSLVVRGYTIIISENLFMDKMLTFCNDSRNSSSSAIVYTSVVLTVVVVKIIEPWWLWFHDYLISI